MDGGGQRPCGRLPHPAASPQAIACSSNPFVLPFNIFLIFFLAQNQTHHDQFYFVRFCFICLFFSPIKVDELMPIPPLQPPPTTPRAKQSIHTAVFRAGFFPNAILYLV